ncbi:MAG: AfsR/SARP family transcriptional regulator [Nocardioides sp.]
MTNWEFCVLGDLRAVKDGRDIAITATRQRVLLAVLLFNANRSVSVEALIAAIWGETPPRTARVTVQNYIRRLRAVLDVDIEDRLIETTAAGYRLTVATDEVDLLRFIDEIGSAQSATSAGRTDVAIKHYRAGLAMWRDEPIPDLARAGWLRSEVSELVESHLAAVEEWADLELAADRSAGGGAELIAALTGLIAHWPLRESLRALLMRALYASGRTADALAEYTKARLTLVNELGVEPGPQLLAAHQHVLGGHRMEPGRHLVPAQLPPMVPELTGRDNALAELDRLLDGHLGWGGNQCAIAAVSGTAGVGKTALAVHWAHQVAHRFPDGQLYVNLRGFDPAGLPVRPDEALRGFLTALGVVDQAVPDTVPAQSALFRSLVADRELVIVLDNAAGAEQVRPLLPGAGGCVTVITSRDRLLALVAANGATSVRLDLLAEESSVELLRRRAGAQRIDAEPDAAREIATHCAGLPLALAIAAARIAADPHLPLATLAGELADPARQSLDVLRSGDRSTELREVLSWSTQALEPEAARVFRLLGLHPGPDFTPQATAHLVERDEQQTHALLDDLCRAHLLVELRPGRYSFHDLLRAHAAELAARHETSDDQTAALRRLFEHLLITSAAASSIVDPRRRGLYQQVRRSSVRPPAPSLASEPCSGAHMDRAAAQSWLTHQTFVLSVAIQRAAELPGLEGFAWRLNSTTSFHRTGCGQLKESIRLHEIALSACLRLADQIGEAEARLGLGATYTYLGSFDAAARELRAAHRLALDAGDQLLEAHVHERQCALMDRTGDARGALDQSLVSLAAFREIGDDFAAATAENNLGWCLTLLGDHKAALAYCERALAFNRKVDDQIALATCLDSLGRIYLHLGRHAESIESYVEAVAIVQEEGRHLQLSEYIWHLGDAYHTTGDHQAARSSWQGSLDLLEELDHPNAAVLRAKLTDQDRH